MEGSKVHFFGKLNFFLQQKYYFTLKFQVFHNLRYFRLNIHSTYGLIKHH